MLDLTITKDSGWNGPYKQAVGRFQHKSEQILVKLPRPVADYNKNHIKMMKKQIEEKKNPHYIVKSTESRGRADGKGNYDIVHFQRI